jgi:hypothetical protein
MARNLNNFNNQFCSNTENLGNALKKVNESYKLQVNLLESVNKIVNKDLSKQNLLLYTALQNSTNQIETLAQHLNASNEYLTNVQRLNKQLDEYEDRTKCLEYINNFYRKYDDWLSEHYDEANRALNEVVIKHNQTITQVFEAMKSDLEEKRHELDSFIAAQNNVFTTSSEDLVKVAKGLDEVQKGLAELGEVQKAVKSFEASTRQQNEKIDTLAKNLEKWALTKDSGGRIQIEQKQPKWLKVMIIVGVSFIGITCLLNLIPKIIEWINLLF